MRSNIFNYHCYLLLLLFTTLPLSFFAQSITISGSVQSEGGSLLENASVEIIERTTSNGPFSPAPRKKYTTTNRNGKFSIIIPWQANRINVSLLGYETTETPIGTSTNYIINLKKTLSRLNYPEDFFDLSSPSNNLHYGEFHFENSLWSLIYPQITVNGVKEKTSLLNRERELFNLLALALENKKLRKYGNAITNLDLAYEVLNSKVGYTEKLSLTRLQNSSLSPSFNFFESRSNDILEANRNERQFPLTGMTSSSKLIAQLPPTAVNSGNQILFKYRVENEERFRLAFENQVLKKLLLTDKNLPKHPVDSPNSYPSTNYFTHYYLEHLIIPILKSDLYSDIGQYENALRQILYTYHENEFVLDENNLHEDMLEATYGMLPTPFNKAQIVHNGQVTPIVGKIPYGGKKDQFGKQYLHAVEKEFIKIKLAETYLKWGDALFKSGSFEKAKGRYAQILRIFYNYWENTIHNPNEDYLIRYNPVVLEMVYLADMQLQKIKNGQNYFGYAEDYTPLWNYDFLRNTAREFIENARRLEERAFTSFDRSENESEKTLNLKQGLDLTVEAVELEKMRVKLTEKSLNLARENYRLAYQRLVNKSDQINKFKDRHPIATAKNSEKVVIAGTSAGLGQYIGFAIGGPIGAGVATWGGAILGSTVGKVGGFVSDLGGHLSSVPYIGSLFGSASRIKEQKEQLAQMEREKRELAIAITIAEKEIEREEISKKIALKGLSISKLKTQHHLELLNFSSSRELNEEFWHQFTQSLQDYSKHYINQGIELAWLTQRAYEIEEEDEVNMIKLDYTAYQGTRKWLVSEQLLQDLNNIEFRRITNKSKKEIPISHVVSLRNKNFLDMTKLKETGVIQFAIMPQELDLAFPGTYRRLIDNVEINIVALSNYTGIKGQLTKAGVAWQRTKHSGSNNSWDDWIDSDYNIVAVKHIPETMILPLPKEIGAIPTEINTLKTFQGHGVTGLYELELPKYSNSFDYNTIVDVFITINFSAYYDENLKRKMEEKMCELQSNGELPKGEIAGFSMLNHFPDIFYYFQNPIKNNSEPTNIEPKSLEFFLTEDLFLPNQNNRKLTSIWLTFLGNEGLINVNAQVRSSNSNGWLDLPYIENNGQTFKVRKTENIPIDTQLLDSWSIQINENNETFDYSTIKDVIIQFGYEYDLPLNCN